MILRGRRPRKLKHNFFLVGRRPSFFFPCSRLFTCRDEQFVITPMIRIFISNYRGRRAHAQKLLLPVLVASTTRIVFSPELMLYFIVALLVLPTTTS